MPVHNEPTQANALYRLGHRVPTAIAEALHDSHALSVVAHDDRKIRKCLRCGTKHLTTRTRRFCKPCNSNPPLVGARAEW